MTTTRRSLSLGALMTWVQAQPQCPICQEEQCDCWQVLAAAPALLEALKAWVSASGWSELPNPDDFDSLTPDERRAWVLTKQALDKLGGIA